VAERIKVGEIYWVDDLPPLDGTEPSRRPAIVIDIISGEPLVVIGVTTDRSDPTRIDLPNLRDEPGCCTKLPERCCAIPRWVISIDPDRLRPENYIGYLPQVTLEALARAVDEFLSDWGGGMG
jgi:mRNA-degrading endonuclease toxin of MazEF toxin-antitoxin module